jgi:hypothetical protein
VLKVNFATRARVFLAGFEPSLSVGTSLSLAGVPLLGAAAQVSELFDTGVELGPPATIEAPRSFSRLPVSANCPCR